MTSAAWPNIMGGPSDSMVPVTSQLNGGVGPIVLAIAHSGGMERLGFYGPYELQTDQSPASGILNNVIQLLNTPSGSTCALGSCASPFSYLP